MLPNNSNEKNMEKSPDIIKQEIEDVSDNLTLGLSKFSKDFKDLPNRLDDAFEFTIKKQSDVASDLNDSYRILKSLKKSALSLVGIIGVTQFIIYILVWRFLHGSLTAMIVAAVTLIPYGVLAYRFYSDEGWKKFNTKATEIKSNFEAIREKHKAIFGQTPKNNIYSVFSEFKEKVLSGVKSVFEAAITFSSYGKLYRESLEYMDSLKTFKESFMHMLNRYNVHLTDSEIKFVEGFNGDHLPSSLWIECIVEQINCSSFPEPIIIKLFYFETVNSNVENANLLMQLKKDSNLDSLINYLIYSEIISVKFDYPEEWISKVLLYVISDNEIFSLPQIRSKFENQLYSIQTFLARFNRMISLYEIDYPTPISKDFLPRNILNFESEYLDFMSRRVGTTKLVMNLLYVSVWDEEKTNSDYRALLKEAGTSLIDLSKFFLKHNFKTSNFSEETMSRIIAGIREFKLTELRGRVNLLENIVTFENQFQTYLKNNNFPYRLRALRLNNEIISLASDKSKDLFTKYIELSELMIALPDQINERLLFHGVLLLIFFNDVSSPLAKEVNNEALIRKEILLVLYKFIVLSQDSLPENRLAMVADAVQYKNIGDEQDPVYSEFVWRLQQGQFIRYIPSLMSPMLKEISERYKNLQSQNSYSKIDIILSNLFKRRVGREQVIKMLSGNLIESYLVTVPSKGKYTEPIISYISDSKELQEAQKELASEEDDPAFNNLVKVASSGTFTRIGIIPEGTSFPDFSNKFEKVLRRILTKIGHEDYPVYLTRVSASSQMTSVVMDTPSGESSPFVAIRNLAESVLSKEKLAALYAITNIRKAGKLGISDLISDLIDSDYGGIINLIPEIPNGSILSKIDPASVELKTEINNQLCEKFSANSTTELCKKITHQSSSFGQEKVLATIRKILFEEEGMQNENKYAEEIAKGILDVALSFSKLIM